MKLNKLAGTFFAVAMICSLATANVIAEGTLCDKVGISSDLSTHKVIKLDGYQGTEYQTNIANTQVINLGDSIGMFSSPWNSYYRLTANSARSTILNSTNINLSGEDAVTSAGYHLYCHGADGINDGTKTVENGGWVRAMNDQEVIDIPIVDSAELVCYDGPDIGKDWLNVPSGISINRDAAGLGGKAYDDTALQFTVNAGTTISSGNPVRADTRGLGTLNTPKTVITVEFAVRVTGDAVASLQRNSGYDLMKLKADGKMKYYSYDGGQKDIEVCSDASQWHNVAITYDYAGNRIVYYFDGIKLDNTGDLTSIGDLTELRFGLDSLTYTVGGTVAFDDLVIRRGYYTGRGTAVSATDLSDTVAIDTAAKKVYYNPDSIDATALCNALLSITDAAKASVYTDTGLTAAVTADVTEGNAVVLKTADKGHYETYEIEKRQDELFISSGNGVIEAKPLYSHASGKLLIAEYDPLGNRLVSLAIGDDANSAAIADNTSAGRVYKVFLWNSLDDITPILKSADYPAQ